jgi:hypothetical protein
MHPHIAQTIVSGFAPPPAHTHIWAFFAVREKENFQQRRRKCGPRTHPRPDAPGKCAMPRVIPQPRRDADSAEINDLDTAREEITFGITHSLQVAHVSE